MSRTAKIAGVAGLAGLAIVLVVIFVFLGTWRATLIPAVTIPVSLLAAAIDSLRATIDERRITLYTGIPDMGQGTHTTMAIIAAEVLGMENEIGKLAPGYSADIIAVKGNPLDNVRVLEDVDWVMVRGRVIE